jgi:hypothetical protein
VDVLQTRRGLDPRHQERDSRQTLILRNLGG